MRPGRPTPALLLARSEREALVAWTRQPKCPQSLALRARLILLCAAGRSNTETAAELHITIQTVGKWRQRFIEKRLDGLLDEPRPGTPRKLSEAEPEVHYC
jgi:transposase